MRLSRSSEQRGVLAALAASAAFFVLLIFILFSAAPAESSARQPGLSGIGAGPQQVQLTVTPTKGRGCSVGGITCTPTKVRRTLTATPTRTFTPLPTNTPKEPTDTPWPTDTPTEIPTFTPTKGITFVAPRRPTLTRTATATSTNSPVPTDTPTPVPTPTASAVPTETPTQILPPPPGAHIVVSEFRTSGRNGPGDQFVEIYNPAQGGADIGGWKIQVLEAGPPIAATDALTIPIGTVLQPGQHFLAANAGAGGYGGTVKPDAEFATVIPPGGGILLTTGSGAVMDAVVLSPSLGFRRGTPLAPLTGTGDTSYERKLGGAAGSCVDTGDNASDFKTRSPSDPQNLSSPLTLCGGTATPTATPPAVVATRVLAAAPPGGALDFRSNYFFKTIGGPRTIWAANVETLVTNLLLAILLAFLFGVFATLLADTVESNEGTLRGWLRPFAAVFRRAQALTVRLGTGAQARGFGWVVDLLRIALVMLLYGIVFAFLDPGFSLTNADAWLIILALTLSLAFVSLSDDLARLLYVRRMGGNATIRVHSGNILLVAAAVLVSRISALTPGFLFGTPGGMEGEEKGNPARVSLVAIAALGLVALLSWLATLALPGDGAEGAALWFATLFLLTFAAALQSLLFELVPLQFLYGRSIFQASKVLWALLFIAVAFVFVQTMLNPDGAFLSAFENRDLQTLAFFVAAFCVFATAVWIYFNRRKPAGTAG